jgi:pyridoxamine 5'-phosphate oxidase
MTPETLTGDGSMVLPEFDSPPADPIALLRSWIDVAVKREVREPMSVALATTDSAGRPANRTLMIKNVGLSAAESDALFADRPPQAQATTAASEQSRPLDSEAELRSRAAALLLAGVVTRPAGWSGYLLVPDEVEFWHGSTDRLHRRLRYARTDGGWSTQRLQP